MKALYCYYNDVAKSAKDPFVSNNDEEAKLRFTNDMNAQRALFVKQKLIFPIDRLFLYKLAIFDDEKPFVEGAPQPVSPIMCASECPSYDGENDEDVVEENS